MKAELIELAADRLFARKLNILVALLLLQLPSHLGRAHPRVKSVRAKASVGLALAIDQISNIGQQGWQVRLHRFSAGGSSATINAFDAAFQLMQSFVYCLTIPPKFLSSAIRHPIEHLYDCSSNKQPLRMSLEHLCCVLDRHLP